MKRYSLSILLKSYWNITLCYILFWVRYAFNSFKVLLELFRQEAQHNHSLKSFNSFKVLLELRLRCSGYGSSSTFNSFKVLLERGVMRGIWFLRVSLSILLKSYWNFQIADAVNHAIFTFNSFKVLLEPNLAVSLVTVVVTLSILLKSYWNSKSQSPTRNMLISITFNSFKVLLERYRTVPISVDDFNLSILLKSYWNFLCSSTIPQLELFFQFF